MSFSGRIPWLVLLLTTMAVGCAKSHSVYRVDSAVDPNGNSVLYALPRTVNVVKVPILHTDIQLGECVMFLNKLFNEDELKLKEDEGKIDGTKTIKWEIENGTLPLVKAAKKRYAIDTEKIEITSRAEPDPLKVFRVELTSKNQAQRRSLVMALSEFGLPVSAKSDVEDLRADYALKTIEIVGNIAGTAIAGQAPGAAAAIRSIPIPPQNQPLPANFVQVMDSKSFIAELADFLGTDADTVKDILADLTKTGPNADRNMFEDTRYKEDPEAVEELSKNTQFPAHLQAALKVYLDSTLDAPNVLYRIRSYHVARRTIPQILELRKQRADLVDRIEQIDTDRSAPLEVRYATELETIEKKLDEYMKLFVGETKAALWTAVYEVRFGADGSAMDLFRYKQQDKKFLTIAEPVNARPPWLRTATDSDDDKKIDKYVVVAEASPAKIEQLAGKIKETKEPDQEEPSNVNSETAARGFYYRIPLSAQVRLSKATPEGGTAGEVPIAKSRMIVAQMGPVMSLPRTIGGSKRTVQNATFHPDSGALSGIQVDTQPIDPNAFDKAAASVTKIVEVSSPMAELTRQKNALAVRKEIYTMEEEMRTRDKEALLALIQKLLPETGQ